MGHPPHSGKSNHEIAQDLLDAFDEIYGTETTIEIVSAKRKKSLFWGLLTFIWWDYDYLLK